MFEDSLSLQEVLELIKISLKNKKPYSLVRFGHGEIIASGYKIYKDPYFDHTKYAGITEFSDRMALSIINSLKKADIVGIANHTPRTNKTIKEIMDYYSISFPITCNAWICGEMIKSSEFFKLLRQLKVAIVGRRAKEGADKFKDLGIKVVATIGHEGFDGIPKTMKEISNMPSFDIILVSAGVPATIMCPDIAEKTGKVAIDFGHALDILIDGQKFDLEKQIAEFNKKTRGKGYNGQ